MLKNIALLPPLIAGCLGLTLLPQNSNAKDHSIKIENPQQFLPPTLAWHGASEQLVESRFHRQTPIEQSDFNTTPDYQQTIRYLEQLAASSPLIKLSYFGRTAQGRQLPLIHVSTDFNAKNRPSVLAQAGIHSGEIDGKDAGLMMLRDFTLGKKLALIENIDLLFVPIFNADGHENSSIYNRVNQRGPTNMGWRSTATNLNLNRDYAKAQSVEMQAMLKLINHYEPSLYLDLHVTDGTDYQYDITYGTFAKHSYSPRIAQWFEDYYRPHVDKDLSSNGHVPGPLVFAMDNSDIKQGIKDWVSTPRYSDGYGAARHLPTVLVENHSLKPYRQRVLGTYVFLESSLQVMNHFGKELTLAITQDKQSRPSELALNWSHNKPTPIAFKGIDYERFDDPISGAKQVRWLGTKKLYKTMPFYKKDVVNNVTKVPKAYWLMPEQTQAIDTLKHHGIEITTLAQAQTLTLEQSMATNEVFGKRPYEGAMRVKADFTTKKIKITLPVGSVRISTDQALGKLAFSLLEPKGPDSLFQWGVFNTIFQRTEYIEGYAIVPLANEMLAQSPQLKAEFTAKLASDKAFADNPRARLAWFYQRSPFYDRNHRRYPVFRQW
ncbi:M14 family metallopeptidase [Psychrobium sp. 1_MG-2023]|uniref:M14 family metallopeptidase n=1 Tax=Psychrobium sp. 1_MG-2023 TaxID=3062624 RepID=UPI00269258A6|nr:M14 family metallopeptidase [Psychrobium sp. 1_MG-2023]MDP2560546.1 M14 family metallopeptidase [Psychrobium sp. 1_MG-2023]